MPKTIQLFSSAITIVSLLITSHSTSNQLVLNSPDQKITFSDGIPLDICLSSCFRRSHFTKKQGLILILRRLKENLDEQFSSNKLNLDYLYDITASNILLDNSFNLIDIDTGLVCNFQRSSLSTFYTIRMLFHYVRKHRRSFANLNKTFYPLTLFSIYRDVLNVPYVQIIPFCIKSAFLDYIIRHRRQLRTFPA